ncbi:MotA/TolQ/ExbB proton channel (plasmid) [Sulfuricurvum kujiense DSM 16994]|uniref:MotA/TolQ/ExbB proton channel n=1 Tax=Sulfuricurvum kujiense (strain ATCC BAA-921 / DSM 16994 / JCM 11577 / YK-1) TaxID=709032 RepID=E4U3L6_SULKY|nr:MotA/TolQ/ExbB proton channel family protein [Sulfuricurvum kujiense]ADR35282.1 MotA/TolQ/ExbB proton channel [Sulfuricurvum kujiense DSM 16994]
MANPNEIKALIEYGVMTILLASLGAIIYLSIDRFSNFRFIVGQLMKFGNKTELEIELNRKMTLIYSISSNAVYIGLLGTVLGVMVTLSQIGSANQSGLIAALSLPLISTAASLVVAIIGTFFFNALQNEIDVVRMKWDVVHGHAAQTKVGLICKDKLVENEEVLDGSEDQI